MVKNETEKYCSVSKLVLFVFSHAFSISQVIVTTNLKLMKSDTSKIIARLFGYVEYEKILK